MIDRLAIDRLDALHTAMKAVRRGGTVSISGVYGGEVDPMPMMELFDRRRPDPDGSVPRQALGRRDHAARARRATRLGTEDLATHVLPLADAPHGYEIFQKKQDGCMKVLLTP